MRNFLYIFIAAMMALSAGCKKKDRLTQPLFNFEIIPAAASIVKGQAQTFQAVTSIPGGANPVWSLSGGAEGDLNTTFGPTVVLTPSTLADMTLTATFEGTQTTAQVAVITYQPGIETFDIYVDAGLPVGTGIASDIFTVGAVSLAEQNSGYTPEGIKFMRQTSGFTGQAWGVTLDKNVAGLTKNLSAFSGGTLKFSILLGNRVVGVGETIRINLTDASGPSTPVPLSSGVGFNRLSRSWQEVTITLASYPGINLSLVKVPFSIEFLSVSPPLTIDVDAVRWEK